MYCIYSKVLPITGIKITFSKKYRMFEKKISINGPDLEKIEKFDDLVWSNWFGRKGAYGWKGACGRKGACGWNIAMQDHQNE